MNTVIICKSCSNVFNKYYRYCPFCGIEKQEPESLGIILDKTFKKIDKVRTRSYLLRLQIMEKKLAVLEQELDELALGKR